jgi:hypothetical protein
VSEHTSNADLSKLLKIFYASPEELGSFTSVSVDETPEPYRGLLAHPHHMTVAMEQFHESLVDVHVDQVKQSGSDYARRIVLTRQSDGRIVQFGIVRIDFGYLDDAVRKKIESQSTPLGRILIEHKVLREIELVGLWRVTAGPDLARLLEIKPGSITYGRTAVIHCNHAAAVELLEIATPAE